VNEPGRIELVGSKGTLVLTSRAAGGYQVGNIEWEASIATDPVPQPVSPGLVLGPANVSEAYARLESDIRNGTRTVPDFATAVRITRVLDAIDAASDSGRRQALR
jgi:predicted dehydrogenase